MMDGLPVLTPAEASFGRTVLRHRILPNVLGRSLELGPPPEPPADAMVYGVHFQAGPARITAPAALVRDLLAGLDPAAPSAPPAWGVLLLELALSPALDALRTISGALAATLSTDAPPQDVCPYAAGLVLGGTPILLELSQVVAAVIATQAARLPPTRRPVPGLPIALAARLAWCCVPAGRLRASAPGDVILPDTAAPGRLFLICGETKRWPARHEAGRIIVDGARQAASPEKDWWMQDEDLPEEGEADAPLPELDDIPVRLSFEIGRLDVTLAELETLGAGHVFDLHRPEADGVDIMANGHRIGAGRAVTINGTLGVQIVRLAGR